MVAMSRNQQRPTSAATISIVRSGSDSGLTLLKVFVVGWLRNWSARRKSPVHNDRMSSNRTNSGLATEQRFA